MIKWENLVARFLRAVCMNVADHSIAKWAGKKSPWGWPIPDRSRSAWVLSGWSSSPLAYDGGICMLCMQCMWRWLKVKSGHGGFPFLAADMKMPRWITRKIYHTPQERAEKNGLLCLVCIYPQGILGNGYEEESPRHLAGLRGRRFEPGRPIFSYIWCNWRN